MKHYCSGRWDKHIEDQCPQMLYENVQIVDLSSFPWLQDDTDGDPDETADDLETGFDHPTDNSNDENDIDEETM